MSTVGLPRLIRHLKECGEKGEAVTDFIFLGSNIIADTDCSDEIKGHLLLRRKAMTNLDNILKSRDIANNGPYSQSYSFSSFSNA